jgi:ribosomal protein S18 acetylase RimI-like enzyme
MKTEITVEINDAEWLDIAALLAEAIPNTVISKLGNSFGAVFYSKVAAQDYSCVYAARNESNNIVGVIIGSIDYPKAHSAALKSQRMKLTISANFRLFSWSVISWMIKGILAKIRGTTNKECHDSPAARLVAIAVRPEARGTKLAQELVGRMEKFMVSKGLKGPYAILTEKANERANRFYKKIGAEFVRTSLHHGREINEWNKKIMGAKQGE